MNRREMEKIDKSQKFEDEEFEDVSKRGEENITRKGEGIERNQFLNQNSVTFPKFPLGIRGILIPR